MTRLGVPLVVLALALGGCGDDDEATDTASRTTTAATTSTATGETGRYPAAARKTFLDACLQSSKGRRDICECALGKLEAAMPYDEFVKADRAIRQGRAADRDAEDKIRRATTECL